jgi:hypothetical protein
LAIAAHLKPVPNVGFGSRLCENTVNDMILRRFGRRIR